MGRLISGALLALALSSGAVAQEAPAQDIPARDVIPSKDQTGVVHVSAMKNPEMHTYRAVVAGLDIFDELHALAPKVPKLVFAVRARNGGPMSGEMPTVKLLGDDFSQTLPVDGAGLVEVPRSQRAWDAKAEVILSRKRNEVRVWPHVRTPGLADNQRRLGDIRLECQVLIAVAKKETPFYIVGLVNTVLLTGDWCNWLKDSDRTWDAAMPYPLASATLRDGERSMVLRVKDNRFMVPLGDASWSNDALVEVVPAPVQDAAAPAEPTRTAAETPRTGP
jgi:hypothetical protein